ncbi:MAG: LysR family transcriptional regulator [Lachnospiraceae bacterium]|nr:LysR family transcriptional regulator [Lachnospiraceae bacterium]
MDIKDLEYFAAIATEGTISKAAEALHITQPGLSRKMKELEESLGTSLFERGSRRIHLTEEGMILKRRADEVISLMQRTQQEIIHAHDSLSGVVHIGAGESKAFHYLSRIIRSMQQDYPDVGFTVTSGDTTDLMEQLGHGLLDVALIFTEYDIKQYQGISIPDADTLGVLMRKDAPLAEKTALTIKDLTGLPLIIPRASESFINASNRYANLNIAAHYNLIYNASVMVEDGIGYAIGFDDLINTSGDSPLTFRPFKNAIRQQGFVIWKKYQTFTGAVAEFIHRLEQIV